MKKKYTVLRQVFVWKTSGRCHFMNHLKVPYCHTRWKWTGRLIAWWVKGIFIEAYIPVPFYNCGPDGNAEVEEDASVYESMR